MEMEGSSVPGGRGGRWKRLNTVEATPAGGGRGRSWNRARGLNTVEATPTGGGRGRSWNRARGLNTVEATPTPVDTGLVSQTSPVIVSVEARESTEEADDGPDASNLTNFIQKNMGIAPEENKLSVSGHNWGAVDINGNMLSFNVGPKEQFEVSLADVSQTQLQGKTDVVLEFHVDDSTTGANEAIMLEASHMVSYCKLDSPRVSDGSYIETLLMELRKVNSELQTWICSEGSEFLSYTLTHRMETLQKLTQAMMFEAKLDDQMIKYRKLDSTRVSNNSEKKFDSLIETSLEQLQQKLSSQIQTRVSSEGSPFLFHALTRQTELLQCLVQGIYCFRSSLREKCQHASILGSTYCDIADSNAEQTAITTSTGQFQAYLPSQQDTPQRNERKRKSMKVHDIPFEVFRVLVDPRKQLYAYRLGKSTTLAKDEKDIGSLPYVSFKRERVNNSRAYHIMAFARHVNILRLKRICDDKSNMSEKTLVAFVEPVKETLQSLCTPRMCMDGDGFIPTETCRDAFRDIIKGLGFLWRIGLYHGNLSLRTTYWNYKYLVKLANFEMQESLSLEEARRFDRNSLVSMLQDIANAATVLRPSCCRDLVDSLIQAIREMDLVSADGLETTLLDNTFFWTPDQRKEFFVTTISIKLNDTKFVNSLTSDLCILPWNSSYCPKFIELVTAMNDYRVETKGWQPYDGTRVDQFVRCICGAYAHKNLIKVREIDRTITRNVPLLVEKLRKLI